MIYLALLSNSVMIKYVLFNTFSHSLKASRVVTNNQQIGLKYNVTCQQYNKQSQQVTVNGTQAIEAYKRVVIFSRCQYLFSQVKRIPFQTNKKTVMVNGLNPYCLLAPFHWYCSPDQECLPVPIFPSQCRVQLRGRQITS